MSCSAPGRRRSISRVESVVSDDHEGLKAAAFRHFQGASWQRCQLHYARNHLSTVGAAKRKEIAEDLRAIFAATTSREQALGIASSVPRSGDLKRAPRR
jgi:putative transposase